MNNLLKAVLPAVVLYTSLSVRAQLPPDFPTLTVTTNYAPAVADGYVFQAVNITAPGLGYYAMIVGNDGVPLWYRPCTNACYDLKVLPNGYLHYAQQYYALTYTGGGNVTHEILDENYYPIESIQAGNGYAAEAHDFQMLPNGNVLLVGYYLTQVDMSQVVSNGNPAARVSGAVIQELDGQRNVVFQWRSWDHYPFTRQWVNSTAAVISEFHINCLFLDADGNLVVSTPDWVKKISRQTGDILWHLGGAENQFTFVGVSQQEGIGDFASHDINRLPNGHVLLYSNSKFGVPGSSSSAKEYALDETNKIATRIWAYTPVPAVNGPFQGSAQRLSNGDTFIGWGGLPGTTKVACTEVAGTNVVFQMRFDNPNVVSYRSFRFPFPSSTQENSVSVKELAQGNDYDFGATGVAVDVQGGAGGYNILTITRGPYAPVYPLFQGKAPLVLPVRLSMTGSSISSLDGVVEFDAQSFGFADPTNLRVYYRQQTGQGLFLPQPTSYNPATGKLTTAISLSAQESDLGEFVFGYPDLDDVPYPPILNEVENYRGIQQTDVIAPRMATGSVTYSVNDQRPILLSWSPKGFARSYQLEISTNSDFSSPSVSVLYQTAADYVWSPSGSDGTYYYRVKTINQGGSSDWSTGSFNTVAPSIQITFPNGGEAFQRGLSYYILWKDNIADDLTLDLYNAGSFVKSIVTNAPSTGAFRWQIGFDVSPGSQYSLRISSSTNASLSDFSDASFSIVDRPTIAPGSLVRLPDGRIQFGVNVPGASQVSVLGSTNFLDWQLVQSVSLINGAGVFTEPNDSSAPDRFFRLRAP